jgi:hypothetical protein
LGYLHVKPIILFNIDISFDHIYFFKTMCKCWRFWHTLFAKCAIVVWRCVVWRGFKRKMYVDIWAISVEGRWYIIYETLVFMGNPKQFYKSWKVKRKKKRSNGLSFETYTMNLAYSSWFPYERYLKYLTNVSSSKHWFSARFVTRIYNPLVHIFFKVFRDNDVKGHKCLLCIGLGLVYILK